MAIETLKNVAEIGGFSVANINNILVERNQMLEQGASELEANEFYIQKMMETFIIIDDAVNSIQFKIQNLPIHEAKKIQMFADFAKSVIDREDPQFTIRAEDGSVITNYAAIKDHCINAAEQETDEWNAFFAEHESEYTGVNGCQVDTIIEAVAIIIDGLNTKFPSEYNKKAYDCLQEALSHLKARRKDREERQVEGKSLA